MKMMASCVISFIAGAAALAALAALMAAQQPQANIVSPRYQITSLQGNLIVLDNQTNRVSLLYKKRVGDKSPPDWPWAIDNSFSLGDALSKPSGAEIQGGIGR